jgi:predicted ATPase
VDFSAAVQFGALFVEFVVVAAEAQGFANVPPLGRGLIATAVSAGPRHDPWQD